LADVNAIEQAFASKLVASGIVKTATTTDTPRIDERNLPQITMVLLQTTPNTQGPIGLLEVEWRWTITLYLRLQDWDAAQAELKSLVPQLVTLITPATAPELRTLNNTVDEAWLLDEGDAPIFALTMSCL
jgi:hypothetical protein